MRYELVDTIDGQRTLKPSLQKLFVDCFSKPLTDSWWEYLYLGSPSGPAISITAWDDEGLAGHYAAIPFPVVTTEGEKTWIARGMTLAVAERARAQGVLKGLLSGIKPALMNRGLAWTIGFPNDLSWRPLVLFCGWKILAESQMLLFDVPAGPGSQVKESAEQPTNGLAPPYSEPTFMQWRGCLRPFRTFAVDDSVGVVAKVLDDDTLDVMDAWQRGPSTNGASIFGLARHQSLARICITKWHAEQVGLDTSIGRPSGYTVRQAVMKNGDEPIPSIRFSLLYSDVY